MSPICEENRKCLPPALPGVDAKVAILLCTYQGERYLCEQLDSFAAQAYQQWEVWASDDGSSDGTRRLLECYQRQWSVGRLHVQAGPHAGFAANFMALTVDARIQAAYYAYSDQDDIWDAIKLERAVAWLQRVPAGVPALYCGRTRLVDAGNNDIGLSALFSKPPHFANALMQNIGGGNTMVFNDAARQLLIQAGGLQPIITHDWWAYLVVTGCGGQVYYDSQPTLRYRQHGRNLVGSNRGWPARVRRARLLLQGQFRHWNDCNIAALRQLESRLTAENRETLERFAKARAMPLIPRLVHLRRSGVYRQTALGNLGLLMAAVLGKV